MRKPSASNHATTRYGSVNAIVAINGLLTARIGRHHACYPVVATSESWPLNTVIIIQQLINHGKQCGTNPKHPGYKNWGGRGITVCDRWQTFENFLADMGESPPHYTIERIDNNASYEADNCTWIPKGEQWKTRRRQDRLTKAMPARLVTLLTEWLEI